MRLDFDFKPLLSGAPCQDFHGQEDSLYLDAVGLPRYRTVFISDLHLGTAGCQATALLEFLRNAR